MEKELLPHQQRVVDELSELKDKTNYVKEEDYLDNPIYLKLDTEDQKDMQTQFDAMCIYCDALERRISRF